MHFEDLTPHYATTLVRWRENFWRNVAAVRDLGMDTRFIRMWHYYLCFCEAGFRERATEVAQLVLNKPRRRAS